MKEPRFWLVNKNGNVFFITDRERYIQQLTRTYKRGVKVKRLAATDWCAWAIGHDHRVYLYVLASDVPIRVSETTYENQRWSPFNGFRSTNLLPTDRHGWSDEHGSFYIPKESIRLPSSHWKWEGDWFVDENLQGEICTDKGGWQYAINFTSKWTAESHWNSCVRKRKWIRFRRFIATNTWATVSDEEVVEKFECFIDIAVGGQLLPNQPTDFLSVWAVTNNGQVYVRKGVCRDCPEGTDWMHIPCKSLGIINISCGPTGLVWAVTWDGLAMVRTHVSRDAVYGLGWEVVSYPEESTRLMQVSVGRNSVWSLCRDGKVWFRQGVNGDKLFWDAKAATGNSWIQMVGQMLHLSVSANDQVFSISLESEEVLFRTGITPSEPGGKTWQTVMFNENPDMYSPKSMTSLVSQDTHPSIDSPDDVFTNSGSMHTSDSSPTSLRDQESGLFSCLPIIRTDNSQTREHNVTPLQLCTPVRNELKTERRLNDVKQMQTCEESKLAGSNDHIKPSDTLKIHSDCIEQAYNSSQSAKNISENNTTNSATKNNALSKAPVITQSISEYEQLTEIKQGSICKTSALVFNPPNDNSRNTVLASVINEIKEDLTGLSSGDHVSQNSTPKVYEPCLEDTVGNIEMQIKQDKTETMQVNICEELASHKKTHELSETVENCLDDLNSLTVPVETSVEAHDSLESGPSSDIIFNFVTDLIDDSSETFGVQNEPNLNTVDPDQGGLRTSQDTHNPTEECASSASDVTGESFSGQAASETSSSQSEVGMFEAFILTPAQPRYSWGWLCASDFTVENPATVPWLMQSSDSEFQFQIPKVTRVIREAILEMLKVRNLREICGFSGYEHAVEKSTWVKKASMKLFSVQINKSWLDCTVEMEQGLGSVSDGTLTLQFMLKQKPKIIQIQLQDLRCIRLLENSQLAIYTCDVNTSATPYRLQAASEIEAIEWMGLINISNVSLWGLNRPIMAGSIWSLTLLGHVFVHNFNSVYQKSEDMFWGQHGGHMTAVETNPCGITWALSFDHTPFVYNGGYGNSITKNLSDISSGLREQVDYRIINVFENQKWFPVVGYCSRGLLQNNFAWKTPSGNYLQTREDVKLPSSDWQWVSEWSVDFTTPGGVSSDGWQYATNFKRPYHNYQGLRDSVRRRQWCRKCKLVTHGPWINVGPPELMDLSLQVDLPESPRHPIVLWAIGVNGDVLARNGITQTNPLGKSWIHIPTTLDKPFQSVSVGGQYRVWAVAKDGSVWYRAGVTPNMPAGSCWIQVIPPPPGGALLQHISAGGTAVWAVDTNGNLWWRENITATFPEGTKWTYVCNHVQRVSVGPLDQVWVVSGANFGSYKLAAGGLYRRLGISEEKPAGTSWELVIGPGWQYVSVRGLMSD